MVLKDEYEWLSAAMADDIVVVELLVRLKQSQASSSSSMKSPATAVIPARWGLRQRRSRILSSFHKNKESSSTRCSPTTPLSWSGDTSPSADGFEQSSHPSSRFSRSKGYGTNELSCSTAMAKKFKRRKALADLRVEESLLPKERVNFKKINLNVDISTNSVRDESKPVACQSVDPSPDNFLTTLPIQRPENTTQPESMKTHSLEFGGFFLPDLNMMPAEDCL